MTTPANADDWIDRRRLRARLGFWRLVAIGLAALLVLSGPAMLVLSGDGPGAGRDTIARVEITGVVRQDRELLELLDDLAEEARVRGVIVAVNTPGGTTTGGETIHEAIRTLAARKPVVSQIETVGASAGYMIASASDHIVAHRSSIVGSIGVLFQYADASRLLDRLGVAVDAVRSTPLKAQPSPFEPAPPESLEMIGRLIDSSYRWFVDLVAARRGFSGAEALALADGSVFTGDQALANGLVDALGGEAEAVRWLEERGVPAGLEVVTREPERDDGPFSLLSAARGAAFALVGLDPGAGTLAEAVLGRDARLDGLVSLWQPYAIPVR